MAFAELTIRSTTLRMDTKVNVIIPENRRDYREMDPRKSYKALYVLHGTCEDNSTWLNSSNLYLLARDLDLFVFMPSGYNMCYVDTKFGVKMHTYISEELPARMAQLFPISTAREDTFIMGESMGGYGSLYTSLMKPEQYGKACILSASGFREFQHLYDTGAHSVDQLMKEKYDAGVQLPEYLTLCGTEDARLYPDILRWTAWVHENCPDVVYKEEYMPGKHDFFFWNQAIPKALAFFGFSLDRENGTGL